MKKENLQKAIDIKRDIDMLLDLNYSLKATVSIMKEKSIDIPFSNGLSGGIVTIQNVDIIIPSEIILKHAELNIAANEERIKFLESAVESL